MCIIFAQMRVGYAYVFIQSLAPSIVGAYIWLRLPDTPVCSFVPFVEALYVHVCSPTQKCSKGFAHCLPSYVGNLYLERYLVIAMFLGRTCL